MDHDEFRVVLARSGVGIWGMIETAIKVASSDYGDELHRRRDRIVELLYAPSMKLCKNCGGGIGSGVNQERRVSSNNVSDSGDDMDNTYGIREKIQSVDVEDYGVGQSMSKYHSRSPLTPESNHRTSSGLGEDGDDLDPYGGLFDDEQTRILSIKEQLEDSQQSEDSVVELLQTLADMDITFQALKETDIGRHVNRLRKHQSGEVRRLVKQLVRKWKEIVDEWVKVNQPDTTSNLIDVDSPQQNFPKNQQNEHYQVPDFGYSPNPINRGSSSERNHVEYEPKHKQPQSAPRRETPSRPPPSAPKSLSAPLPGERVDPDLDDERLNSARRRLQENYQEAENAKKQRTIQVMDIHELPKPKKAFFPKNRGGFQGRHNR